MALDWNWFFSSVAQSTAAIVGIFAAFIITKIINNQVEFSRNKRLAAKLINDSIRLAERARSRQISWYNEVTFKIELEKMIDGVKNDRITSPEDYLRSRQLSPFMPKWYLEEKIKEFFRKAKQERANKSAESILDVIKQKEGGAQYSILAYKVRLDAEEEAINSLLTDIKQNIREIDSILNDIISNPESSPLVTFSIVATLIIYFSGVVYPLHFLPTSQYPEIGLSVRSIIYSMSLIRGHILAITSIVFIVIMTVFMVINLRLKYPKDIINSLKEYSAFVAYSEYFSDIDVNTVLHRKIE